MRVAIALVGRPNVGKSRLFNRLVRHRASIVHDLPGTTRDIVAEDLPNGVTLMDTGGMGLAVAEEDHSLMAAVEGQVHFAIGAADIIFFVVDARAGCTPMDHEIAAMLRKSGKIIYLVANKIDSEREVHRGDIFHILGFREVLLVSAEHGYGERALWDVIDRHAVVANESVPSGDRVIKICLLGRPNVGKSSLANALLGGDRMIVHRRAGTTRDAIASDLRCTVHGREYCFRLVDTAGLREKRKVSSSVEFFSAVRSANAMGAADIVFLVIDALSGITHQDKKWVDRVLEAGKCLIFLVNKWDLADEGFRKGLMSGYGSMAGFRRKFLETLQRELFSLSKCPVLFVSARTRYGMENIFAEGVQLFEKISKTISTGPLNRVIQHLLESHPPAMVLGKRFKIYYAVQSGTLPVRLKIFCNRCRQLGDDYRRYLENGIRDAFDLFGCALRFEFVEKEVRYAEKTA
jgi:GTP-binding protein